MFVHKVKVRFYDTDAMQVVHHANYIRWFEEARIEFFRMAGVSLVDIMNEGIVFPILKVECEYLHAAVYDDDLEVRTYLEKVTRAQLVFRYEVVRPADATLIVRGRTQGTFSSFATKKIVRMPLAYVDRLKAHREPQDE